MMSANKFPEPLFSHCLKLIAGNLDIVEHFLGFPSLIGEKIFRAAEDSTRWSDHAYVTTALKLFTEAFEGEVLSSVNLSGQHLGVNFYLNDLLMFRHVVMLDVSCCGLGDEHELITHITHLERLEELSLKNDCLSDCGIQKMTAPYRMFQKGPADIQLLDISGNVDVTIRSLKYLSPFPRLHTVYLPARPDIQKECVNGWSLSSEVGGKFPAVSTVGWAGNLVMSWMAAAKKRALQIRKKKCNFYSSSRKEQALGQSATYPDSATMVTVVATRHIPAKNRGIQHQNILKSENRADDGIFNGSILRDLSSQRNRSGSKPEHKYAKPKLIPMPDVDKCLKDDDELLNMYSTNKTIIVDEISPNIGLLDQYQSVTSERCSKSNIKSCTVFKKQCNSHNTNYKTIVPPSRKRKRTSVDTDNTLQHTYVDISSSTAFNLAVQQKELRCSASDGSGEIDSKIDRKCLLKGLPVTSGTEVNVSHVERGNINRAKLPPVKKIRLLKSVTTGDGASSTSVSVAVENTCTPVLSTSHFLDALDSY